MLYRRIRLFPCAAFSPLRLAFLQAARVGPPLPIPLYLCRARAGFPSPADDYVEDVLELNDPLIHNKDAPFFARAEGDSMTGAGIRSGDLRRELEAL